MDKTEHSKTFLRECAEEISSQWQKRKKAVKRQWQKPFIYIECICEWLRDKMRKWAFLGILEYAGRLTILVAVIFYFMESKDRRTAKQYQAWQVIYSAQGIGGEGGRISALEHLNRDNILLAGVDVSGAFLAGINLRQARLWEADFSSAVLGGADLSEATLHRAKFWYANLHDANLTRADLSEALLCSTTLSEAKLVGANLAEANLQNARLSRADLRRANLANMRGWKIITTMELANIHGVKDPPKGFVEWAKEHGAVSIESDDEWEKAKQKSMQEKDSSKQEEK